MDPLSIAGFTFALIEQAWTLAERTATLISDYRAFDSDSKLLQTKIRKETNKLKTLKKLLFSPDIVYGGRSLFETFDGEQQQDLLSSFEEGVGVINQASQILDRRQSTEPAKSPKPALVESSLLLKNASEESLPAPSRTTSESLLIPTPPASPPSPSSSGAFQSLTVTSRSMRHRSANSLVKLRWSFRDKGQIERIVQNFTEINKDIFFTIELFCNTGVLAANSKHLRRLGTDEDAKMLGFDVSANLQLAATLPLELEASEKSLEITDSVIVSLLEAATFDSQDGRTHIVTPDERSLLVEYRNYNPGSSVMEPLQGKKRQLVERLANLLSQPKGSAFRTLTCIGWVCQLRSNRVAFLFEYPEATHAKPISLREMLEEKGRSTSLRDRFQLASRLAQCVSHLQLVKWVHESIRSENILFFPSQDGPDLSSPWVMGYEYSRPDPFFSSGIADPCPEREVYRHPDRQGDPRATFTKLHDVYSLGVVLLEIGLWCYAPSLDRSRFSHASGEAIRNALITKAKHHLGSRMGDKYRDLVVHCLAGEFSVTDQEPSHGDLRIQQAFRAQVVEVLEKAADAL